MSVFIHTSAWFAAAQTRDRLGISRVVSFDRGFAVFRYDPRRQIAFTVLR